MPRKSRLAWLGLCEPQNPNITHVRNLMARAVPRGMEFVFVVPPVGRSVERTYVKLFDLIKPDAVLLNDDYALFGSFENYNIFLQCCAYKAGLDLEAQLFVLKSRYEKKIYRDSAFDWYTPKRVWEDADKLIAEEREREARERREEETYARELESLKDFAVKLNEEKR